MSSETKNILIFGATGLIGKRITAAIVNNAAHFNRIVIFTSPNTVSGKAVEIEVLKSKGAEIITGDIQQESEVSKAYNGIDTVVSCVGRNVIQTQVQLIGLADKHPDVKRFFPSEYGTDIEYWPESATEKPHQQKLKVREALKHVKQLDYTYVVTGPYGDADSHLFLSALPSEHEEAGTFDVKRKRAVVLGDGKGRISLTTMRDVGKLVVAALLKPEASRNKALHVNSFTTTPLQIVAEFERQTGGEKWDVSITPIDRIKALESEAWAKGIPNATSFTLRRIWTTGGTLYEKRDNGLIDMEDQVDSLEDAVQQAIEVQKAKTH